MSDIGTEFGLGSEIGGALAGIIGIIGISTTDTGACQYEKGKEILNNIAGNENYYKYLPAIIYPNKVTKSYINTYPDVYSPTYGDLSKAKKIHSTIIRHGLLISTIKDNEIVYFYIGGIPEGFDIITELFVSQGGTAFRVKGYKSIIKGLNINPRFGILPVSVNGEYSTDPPISQGGNGIDADIVGIFNYMASSLYAVYNGTSFLPAYELTSSGNYALKRSLNGKLVFSTSENDLADTPSIHITLTNNLIAPSIPDSVNFNPALQSYWIFNNESFTKAIQGAPIYISHTGNVACCELRLRGFVDYINPVTGSFTVNTGFGDIVLSPGLAIGGVINPPNSWNYDDLVTWAMNNGMGLSRSIFDKWVDLTVFESKVITSLINRGYGYLTDIVHQYFDPAPEVVEQDVDNVVNGITNAVSSGVNSVINFLTSL